jgi:hypothetical protein
MYSLAVRPSYVITQQCLMSISVSVTLGMVPLPESSERTAMAICIGSVLFMNVLGAGLNGYIKFSGCPLADLTTAQPDAYGGFLEQRPATSAGAHEGNTSI